MRYVDVTRTTLRGHSICGRQEINRQKGTMWCRLKMVRWLQVEIVLRWLKKTDTSPRFLPRLEAPPVTPLPPPLSPSSSTEDDGVLYSLQPQFAAFSISLSFSFSPGCPGMNDDVRERQRREKSEEREKLGREYRMMDSEGRERWKKRETIDGYLGRQI